MRVSTVQFHLYDFTEQGNLIYHEKIRTVVASGKDGGIDFSKRVQGNSVINAKAFVKHHQMGYLKCAHFIEVNFTSRKKEKLQIYEL